MNKITKPIDPIQRPFQHSDSDLSLQLSDASSLSSDSDLSDAQQKKKTKKKKKSAPKKINKKKKIKDDIKYCTCRKGYDGKEFMIECDGCQEWFHGACVGLKPNSVTDHYYCKSCLKKKQRKKSIIILPLPKPEIVMPVISKLSIDQDDEDEDLCPVCDGDCTCGPELITPSLPPPPPPPTPVPVQETPKIVIKKTMPATKSKKSKKPKKTIPIKHNISSSEDSDSSDSSEESDDQMIETKKKINPPRRGKSTTLLANIIRHKAPHYGSKGGKKSNFIQKSNKLSSDEDTDEEVVVDDLDDLLETMSPLSEHSSNESNHSSEEFFTDEEEEDIDIDSSSLNMSPYPESRASYSSVHIDSGDDEDIENAETQAIIADMTLDSDEEEMDSDEAMFIEDEEDDDEEDEDDNDEIEEEENNMLSLGYYTSNNNHWSTDEEDEEEEFDYTTLSNEKENKMEESDEEKQQNAFLPLLDSEGNLYDSIASAFMQSLGTIPDLQGDNTHGNNTPGIVGEEYQLSPFELAHALSTLSTENNVDFLRRPSLPSNAVSAAQRNRGSQDFNTSEALRALSALASDELSIVPLESIHEEEEKEIEKEIKNSPIILPNQLALSLSTDLKLQEQILDILKGSDEQNTTLSLEKKSLLPTSRQILPKPSGSGIGTLALEQQIQDAINQKRRNSLNEELNNKKPKLSNQQEDIYSTPASPAAIIDELEHLKETSNKNTVSMDDLVDTSQLYTSLSRSPSPELQDDPYSRDLSRWQRIPIGAFRLMRSKNKLWLER